MPMCSQGACLRPAEWEGEKVDEVKRQQVRWCSPCKSLMVKKSLAEQNFWIEGLRALRGKKKPCSPSAV